VTATTVTGASGATGSAQAHPVALSARLRRLLEAFGEWVTTLAGYSRSLLPRIPDGERRKLGWIGRAVLGSGVLAALSMALLQRTVFRTPLWVAVPLAAAWGTLILNLERLFTANISPRSTWRALAGRAVPALLIGTVVAIPLVDRAFAREIDAELVVQQHSAQVAFEHQQGRDYANIPQMEAQVQSLQTTAAGASGSALATDPDVQAAQRKVDTLGGELAKAEQDVADEIAGRGRTQKANCGPVCIELQSIRDRLRGALQDAQAELASVQGRVAAAERGRVLTAANDAKTELARVQTELGQRRQQRDDELLAFRAHNSVRDGLAARLSALQSLAVHSPAAAVLYLLLIFTLLVADAGGVIAKYVLVTGGGMPGLQAELDREAEERKHAAQRREDDRRNEDDLAMLNRQTKRETEEAEAEAEAR
jgi:hypothetical protein